MKKIEEVFPEALAILPQLLDFRRLFVRAKMWEEFRNKWPDARAQGLVYKVLHTTIIVDVQKEFAPTFKLYYQRYDNRGVLLGTDEEFFSRELMVKSIGAFQYEMQSQLNIAEELWRHENDRLKRVERDRKRKERKVEFEIYKRLHEKYKGRLK
jgi:hypothetical protein